MNSKCAVNHQKGMCLLSKELRQRAHAEWRSIPCGCRSICVWICVICARERHSNVSGDNYTFYQHNSRLMRCHTTLLIEMYVEWAIVKWTVIETNCFSRALVVIKTFNRCSWGCLRHAAMAVRHKVNVRVLAVHFSALKLITQVAMNGGKNLARKCNVRMGGGARKVHHY